MKTIRIVFLTLLVLVITKDFSQAQNLNWSRLKPDQKHILNVNAGFDFAFTYGIGYGYQLNSRIPVVLNLEHSQPAGNDMFDDFKTKIGGQIRLFQIHDFYFISKLQGVFRRIENDYARLLNFGSDMSALIGYYKVNWFVAGEFGFDKAIVTHFKHSDLFRENFPGVKNGWYEPATGGNVYYCLQTGFSIKNNDVSLKAGKVVQQDFKTNPTIPFYFQLGYTRRF